MTAIDTRAAETRTIVVGVLSHDDLLARLAAAGVLLNAGAERLLLEVTAEQGVGPETISVVERSVRDLGLPEGGTLPEIFARAAACGLRLCPPAAGPYLRLAIRDQDSAPDGVLSSGRAPSGSLTVAAPPLRDDDDFPKGFYLRVIDGQPWLRGYRCDDLHVWSAEDRFVFRDADTEVEEDTLKTLDPDDPPA